MFYPGKLDQSGYIPQRFKTYAGIMTNDFSNVIPKMERQIKSEKINQISQKIDLGLG